LNALIEKIYQTKCVEDAEGNSLPAFPTSISYDAGMALGNIVNRIKPKRTLEIGMAYGISTLFICQALHDNGQGLHTAIDPFQKSNWNSIGLLNTKRAGLDGYLNFYEDHSHELLPQLLLRDEKFDFIFIDGKHLFDYALLDFFYSDKLLKVGGYILLDDLWMPSIRKVISFILRNRGYELKPEFIRKKHSLWKRPFIFLRDAAKNPSDLYSISFSLIRLVKGLPNYCILQKVSTDNRGWAMYRPF